MYSSLMFICFILFAYFVHQLNLKIDRCSMSSVLFDTDITRSILIKLLYFLF